LPGKYMKYGGSFFTGFRIGTFRWLGKLCTTPYSSLR
jgi:hypothetical protein